MLQDTTEIKKSDINPLFYIFNLVLLYGGGILWICAFMDIYKWNKTDWHISTKITQISCVNAL